MGPGWCVSVVDVIHRVSDDGKGTYREMSMASGPMSGQRIVENVPESILMGFVGCVLSLFCVLGLQIYHNDVDLVRFVVVNDPNEHVNLIVTDSATGVRSLQVPSSLFLPLSARIPRH